MNCLNPVHRSGAATGCQSWLFFKTMSSWSPSKYQHLALSAKCWYLEGLQLLFSIQLKFEELQMMNINEGILEIKEPTLANLPTATDFLSLNFRYKYAFWKRNSPLVILVFSYIYHQIDSIPPSMRRISVGDVIFTLTFYFSYRLLVFYTA